MTAEQERKNGMQLTSAEAVAAVSELIEAGYTRDFRIRDGALFDTSDGKLVNSAEVTIEAKFRYETDEGSGDASNIYVLSVDGGARKGFLFDAHDLEGEGAAQALLGKIAATEAVSRSENSEQADYRYGVRKVRKAEFELDPARYVLKVGFPDFPPCPFGRSFSMLGFDTARQEYVWLATTIIRDDRLQRIPYAEIDADA